MGHMDVVVGAQRIKSGSNELTGTVHVRFNTMESRQVFLEYFERTTVMHYNRYLRARMSPSEMPPRKEFNSSDVQRAYGACKYGAAIWECVRDRHTTIQKRIEQLCHPSNPVFLHRWGAVMKTNWTDNRVRDYLNSLGEQW